MMNIETQAWLSFAYIINNFLGNIKTENYVELVCETRYHNLNAIMSVKLHLIYSHYTVSQKILEMLVMNREKNFTRISK